MVKIQPKFSICRMQILRVNLGIWLIILVMSSLALAFADNSAKAAKPSSNLNLIPLPDKKGTASYPSYGSHIRIDPPTPTPDDVIRITASGEWSDSCVPRYQSHQIMGNVINIYTTPPSPACLTVIMPWSFTVEISPLPKGFYIVRIYRVGLKSFFVSPEQLYLPVILRNQ